MLVIVGGSGVGKSTLIERALLRRSDRFAFLADTTTRARRATEPLGDGQACPSDKRFVSRADFADLVHEHALASWFRNPVNDEYYGVEWSVLYDAAVGGKVCCSRDDDPLSTWKCILEKTWASPPPPTRLRCW